MLWNPEFLFISHPRTASRSLNLHFASTWPTPVHGLVSEGNRRTIAKAARQGLFIDPGPGNRSLRQAEAALARFGRTLDQFRAIFVTVRHPYALARSLYDFMREDYERNVRRLNFQLARHLDFEHFVQEFEPAPFENWVTSSAGVVPGNLRRLRVECLDEDMREAYRDLGLPEPSEVPHLNTVAERGLPEAISPEAEAAIFRRWRFLFEFGGYERDALPARADENAPGDAALA